MLSKSQYTKYKSCPKHLWLYRHKKEVLTPPDEAVQKKMDRGNDIGRLAQRQFPGGVAISEAWKDPAAAVAQTKALMARGVAAICEAAFLYDDILVLVDILQKTPAGWNIVEVKSSGKNIKPIYLDDISIQNYVVSKSGVPVEHCYLMHINTDYFQTTEQTDWGQFFLKTLMDAELTPPQEIERDLADIKALLAGPEPPAQLDKNGCGGCEAYEYCWKNVPPDSVFEVFRSQKARDYMAQGILRVQDVPAGSCNSDKLNHWVEVYRTQQPYIDRAAVAHWLNGLKYPLYYFDFETCQPVVPLWRYSRPYQQIPFQFSLHVQRKANGPFEHYQYLFEGKQDPRYGCVEAMLKYIGAEGSLIAHHASFERGCVQHLAQDLPLPQAQKEALQHISSRFVDTEAPFKQDYLHPHMHGSSSIKKVLPSLVPELSYEGMPIANGGDAMNAFDLLYFGKLTKQQQAQLRADLLAYCKQDTWAMVKLVEVLRQSVQQSAGSGC